MPRRKKRKPQTEEGNESKPVAQPKHETPGSSSKASAPFKPPPPAGPPFQTGEIVETKILGGTQALWIYAEILNYHRVTYFFLFSCNFSPTSFWDRRNKTKPLFFYFLPTLCHHHHVVYTCLLIS